MSTSTIEVVHLTEARRRDIVQPVVADVYSRFGRYVDLDDLRSEAAIWWYGPGQAYLVEYLEDANLTRLRRSIWRWCARYAEREKAHKIGYEPRDQYVYSPQSIIELLPVALDPEGIPQTGVHEGGPAPHGNLAEGGDLLASLVDVRRALERLPEDDLHFLTLANDLRQDWSRVAVHTETQADSARRRHARIAERMARFLAREEYL